MHVSYSYYYDCYYYDNCTQYKNYVSLKIIIVKSMKKQCVLQSNYAKSYNIKILKMNLQNDHGCVRIPK